MPDLWLICLLCSAHERLLRSPQGLTEALHVVVERRRVQDRLFCGAQDDLSNEQVGRLVNNAAAAGVQQLQRDLLPEFAIALPELVQGVDSRVIGDVTRLKDQADLLWVTRGVEELEEPAGAAEEAVLP